MGACIVIRRISNQGKIKRGRPQKNDPINSPMFGGPPREKPEAQTEREQLKYKEFLYIEAMPLTGLNVRNNRNMKRAIQEIGLPTSEQIRLLASRLSVLVCSLHFFEVNYERKT